jgi:TolB protein
MLYEQDRYVLYAMNADGTNRIRLTQGEGMYGAWSPDGKRLVFNATVGEHTALFVTNADGTGLAPIARPRASAGEMLPTWSPDGTRLAYVDYNEDIYTMNLDGSNVTRLTQNAKRNLDPAWSPDGKQIAFTSNRAGDLEIYVMNADGSNQRRVLRAEQQDTHPTWSPDGKWIAFASMRSAKTAIYVMRADGTDVHRVSAGKFEDSRPAWSPK